MSFSLTVTGQGLRGRPGFAVRRPDRGCRVPCLTKVRDWSRILDTRFILNSNIEINIDVI